MSTAKTFSISISLLLLFIWLPACATLQNISSRQPGRPTAPLQTEPAEPQSTTVGKSADIFPDQPVEEELTLPEPDETVAKEVKELDALGNWEEGPTEPVATTSIPFDFPVTVNKQVQFYLDFFQNEQRLSFARWLARSGRYLPMIEQHLQEANLPLDLVYLPMIESGFSLTAYSRAKAVGPWQFMSGTARHFGLQIDDYVDERRDPVKSTQAAVRYLSRLHAEFGNWQLAVAGYNAGEGKIRWAMRQAETDNFWQLSRYLHTETKRYVPKLIAAIMIAREPEKYGFIDIVYEEPLEFETVEVPRLTSLKAVAVAGATDLELLHDLNRELRQAITPPQQASYPLRVPKDKAELVASNLPRVHPTVSTTYKIHVVNRQETITQICRKYAINKATLLKANNLRSATISPGQRLRIPYQNTTYELLSESSLARLKPAAIAPENLVLHTIKPGETVSGIASNYNVPAHLIVVWNDLRDMNQIRAGQQLALFMAAAEPTIALEETVLTPKDFKLAAVNARTSERQPAARSLPAGKNPPSSPRPTYYQVKSGDNLWEISRRFKVSTEQIKHWNQLQDDLIHPGLQLLLRLAEDRDA
jgi:membrane-bound lytic murein transglycosylase D